MGANELDVFELTAIMPVRNSKSHSVNILSIVKSLKGLPVQLVIVSDSHSPETEIDLENLLDTCKDNQIIFASGDFNSPGLARNRGLDFAESNFVTFWDCDDKPNPGNYLFLSRQMRTQATEIGVGDFEFSDLRFRKTVNFGGADLVSEITSYPGLWRMIFDRDKINLPKFRDFRMAEDQVFLVEIEFEKRKILRESVVVYKYETNVPGQLTRSHEAISDTNLALEFLLSIYFKQNSNLSNQRLLVSLIAKQILSACKHRILAGDLVRLFLKSDFWSAKNSKRLMALLHQIGIQLMQKSMR